MEKTAGEDTAAAGTDMTFTGMLGHYVSAGIIYRVQAHQRCLSKYDIAILAKKTNKTKKS